MTGAAGDDYLTRGAFPEAPNRPPGSPRGPTPLQADRSWAAAAGQGQEGTVSVASAFPGASENAGAAAAVKVKAAPEETPPPATLAPGAKPRWDLVPDAPHSMAKIENASAAEGGGGGGGDGGGVVIVGAAEEQS